MPIWNIITGIITIVTGGLYLCEKYKYSLASSKWFVLNKPNIGKDLKRLAQKLIQIQKWLSSIESNIITDEITHDMWRIILKVKLEGLSYVALHSNDIDQVKMALRNLSQIQGKKAVMRAIKALEGIKSYPLYTSSEELIELVEEVQAELMELLKLEKEDMLCTRAIKIMEDRLGPNNAGTLLLRDNWNQCWEKTIR